MAIYPTAAVDWARARGLDIFHPVTWGEADVQAFIRFKLDLFRATWRLHRATGMVKAIRDQEGRAGLIQAVRTDLHDALAPPPTRMVRHCPCHHHDFKEAQDAREPYERITAGEVEAWIARDRFRRAGLHRRTAAELAWLEREFAPRDHRRNHDVSGTRPASGGGLADGLPTGRGAFGGDERGRVAR